MIQITQIEGDEIMNLLRKAGIDGIDDIGIDCSNGKSRWSYHGGYMEGESKFAVRLNVDADKRYDSEESLKEWIFKRWEKETWIHPHAAMEFLACKALIAPGEYLVYREW